MPSVLTMQVLCQQKNGRSGYLFLPLALLTVAKSSIGTDDECHAHFGTPNPTQKKHTMKLISLDAALSLIDRSERTLWRMAAEGTAQKEIRNGSAMFLLDSIKPHFCIPFTDDDFERLNAALDGDAAAQTDVALIFLNHDKPNQAIYWLTLAAQQSFPDAMNFLGRCYIKGDGVDKDEQSGIIWITKAAALGHLISKAQVKGLSM